MSGNLPDNVNPPIRTPPPPNDTMSHFTTIQSRIRDGELVVRLNGPYDIAAYRPAPAEPHELTTDWWDGHVEREELRTPPPALRRPQDPARNREEASPRHPPAGVAGVAETCLPPDPVARERPLDGELRRGGTPGSANPGISGRARPPQFAASLICIRVLDLTVPSLAPTAPLMVSMRISSTIQMSPNFFPLRTSKRRMGRPERS